MRILTKVIWICLTLLPEVIFAQEEGPAVDPHVVYKGEFGRVLTGGLLRENSYIGNLDLTVNFDLGRLAGLEGWSLFLYGLGNHGVDAGQTPSAHVGDLQMTSNIEARADDMHVYGVHVSKSFWQDQASVLLGLYDLNSEFYVTEASTGFLNGSFGMAAEFAQTGVNGPSIFPYTAPAMRLRMAPNAYYVQAAVLSAQAGDPDHPKGNPIRWGKDTGSLVVLEAGRQRGEKEDDGLKKIALGVWGYTRTFDHLWETTQDGSGNSQPQQNHNAGGYLLLEDNFEHGAYFLRIGMASAEVNEILSNISMGYVHDLGEAFAWSSAIKESSVGIAVTSVLPTSTLARAMKDQNGEDIQSNETTFELYYRLAFPYGVTVQPDLQYVHAPSFSKTTADATIFSERVQLEY